jgi:hypothetical protein
MTIERTLKSARGYERSGYDVFAEIAQGVRPALGEVAKPADWLPVLLKDEFNNEWWVILAGTILSMESAISGVPRIIPCTAAGTPAITYRDYDIAYTVDADNPTGTGKALVTAAGDASAAFAASLPMGWAWHHMYSASIEARLINYEIQPFVSVLCDYEIELALIDNITTVQNFAPGSLVKPGNNTSSTPKRYGLPYLYVDASDSAELICGRVLFRDTIPYGTSSRSRIDLQKPVKGLGLSGVENGGRPRHLDCYQLAAPTTRVTDFIRVNTTLL